mmetsp:Transcript_5568/g.13855  ORF Transcript_5568/g.13855 Transcript_5568/m.13855 type:complete len:199 (-) Transcript_5568:127-723(-)|eukprot:CAMPEP_0181354490 /NCGR_PEP_ID=MMETSP1106-20121128/3386_1 /TAXON_ID=81844 /ORGANISM="Mantoniella antarctica, Strain SL-175" /LENGTH=198 /DNA_ID=CAMNT_0023467151 /DNA_START=153 /DNA_END=749 /DNA_ORIENTATION=-
MARTKADFIRYRGMMYLRPAPEPPSTPTPEEDEEEAGDAPACRFCYDGTDARVHEALIVPCKCSGSQAYVHVRCLKTWRNVAVDGGLKCQVCREAFPTYFEQQKADYVALRAVLESELLESVVAKSRSEELAGIEEKVASLRENQMALPPDDRIQTRREEMAALEEILMITRKEKMAMLEERLANFKSRLLEESTTRT